MTASIGVQFDLPLTTTPIRYESPYWQPIACAERGWLLFGGPAGIYLVTNEGYPQSSIAPVVGFHGWTRFETLLYVQDGPVLQLYDLAAAEDFDEPFAAVNVLAPTRVFRPGDQSWDDAKVWLYAHAAPGPFSAPLVRFRENYRSVFVLAASGAICQFDKALGSGQVVQKPVPDALVWRLETVGGKPYICYSSGNTVEPLDAETLHETPVPLPQALPNGVGWINARNVQEAEQPTVFLRFLQKSTLPWVWASRVDGCCTVSGQLLLDWANPSLSKQPVITVADPGPGGWPILGQGGMTGQPPPASVRSASISLGARYLVGPPLFQYEGSSYAAYLLTTEDRTLHCQKWILPPLVDDPGLRQQWADAYSGANVARDIGLMARLFAGHVLPPAFQTLGLARQMFDAGVSTAGPF